MSLVGIVAKKLGMDRVFNENGQVIVVTKIKILRNKVIAHKTQDKHGYNAVVLGYSERDNQVDERKINKPQRVAQEKLDQGFFKHVKEFRVSEADFLPIGTVLDAEFAQKLEIFDVRAKSKGKGFAGVMKRHNFAGLRATHGVSLSHRSHGSTGNRTEPGRVFKNKKMAGHLGDEFVTVQNLPLVSVVDSINGILLIKGAIPGANGSLCILKKKIKSK